MTLKKTNIIKLLTIVTLLSALLTGVASALWPFWWETKTKPKVMECIYSQTYPLDDRLLDLESDIIKVLEYLKVNDSRQKAIMYKLKIKKAEIIK